MPMKSDQMELTKHEQHCPLLYTVTKTLTTDGDPQLHVSPLGQFDVEGSAAGNHGLYGQ